MKKYSVAILLVSFSLFCTAQDTVSKTMPNDSIKYIHFSNGNTLDLKTKPGNQPVTYHVSDNPNQALPKRILSFDSVKYIHFNNGYKLDLTSYFGNDSARLYGVYDSAKHKVNIDSVKYIHWGNGDEIDFSLPQPEHDSAHSKLILLLNAGMSFPMGSYGSPTQSDQQPSGIYGYSQNGSHFDLTAAYIPKKGVGLAARYGIDLNQASPAPQSTSYTNNSFYQYLFGLYFKSRPNTSIVSFYFLALVGGVKAIIPNSDNWTYYSNTYLILESGSSLVMPGTGSGVGGFLGTGVSIKRSKHFSADMSLGYFISSVSFQHENTVSYDYITVGTTTQTSVGYGHETGQMNINILQLSLCLRYYIN